MRNETRVVKNLLLHYFPQQKIKVRFVEAKQYYTTSDKIIVSVPSEIADDVIATLRRNVQNIKVSRKGETTAISGISCPLIFNVVNNKYYDAEMVEFIEVETIE